MASTCDVGFALGPGLQKDATGNASEETLMKVTGRVEIEFVLVR